VTEHLAVFMGGPLDGQRLPITELLSEVRAPVRTTASVVVGERVEQWPNTVDMVAYRLTKVIVGRPPVAIYRLARPAARVAPAEPHGSNYRELECTCDRPGTRIGECVKHAPTTCTCDEPEPLATSVFECGRCRRLVAAPSA